MVIEDTPAHVVQELVEVEKGVQADSRTDVSPDVILVSWDGLADPANPYNWSKPRKWFTTILTSLGGLVTLMSGAMLAPALSVVGRDLHISEAEASLALSIFVLAFAFGPMVLAPCSEVFGRRPIWIVGGTWYVIWNTVCGFSRNRSLMILGRFLAGLGASAEFAVSGPIVADIWPAEDRGKSLAVRGFLPLLGPALGPILGGLMVQNVSWRWSFFALSIIDAIIVILFLVFLPETHAQTLLSRKAKMMRKSTGGRYHTKDDLVNLALTQRLKLAAKRPFRLLLMQPVIQIVSLILAYQFGLLYIALSTFSSLWTSRYHQTPAESGLHYLAIVIGYTIASFAGGWTMDRVWAHYKANNHSQTRPEHRVPLIIPGSVLMPIGLLWYGWAAEVKMHWIMPDIGIAIFGCGFIAGGQGAQAYIVEAFIDYTASAAAASQLLRNVFAFAFPIFAPSLYSALGYGLGNTTLAAIALILGLPGPFILWKYGERLRAVGAELR